MVREMPCFINRYKVLSLFSRPANYFAVSFDPFLTRKTTKATDCTGWITRSFPQRNDFLYVKSFPSSDHYCTCSLKILDVDPRNTILSPRLKESRRRLLKGLTYKPLSSKQGVTQRHPDNTLPSCSTGLGPKGVYQLFAVADGLVPLEK